VTPSDNPGRNGQNADPEAERTSVLATEEEPQPAAVQAVPAGSSGPEPNGEVTEETHASVPPPWARVSADPGYAAQQAITDQPTIEAPAEIPFPDVVTGTAAASLFTDPGTETPPHGYAIPARTTVHLEGANAAAPGRPVAGVAASPNVLRRPGRGPRRANLQIKRFDPWSVLKLSLVLGVALFFVWLVAVGALYAVLDGMGVWDKVNGISTDLLQGNEGNSQPLISAGRVFGIAAIVGAINIVLFSALATVGAFVYNVSADLAGGLEVTLAERE
jgi:hypothetical protein